MEPGVWNNGLASTEVQTFTRSSTVPDRAASWPVSNFVVIAETMITRFVQQASVCTTAGFGAAPMASVSAPPSS